MREGSVSEWVPRPWITLTQECPRRCASRRNRSSAGRASSRPKPWRSRCPCTEKSPRLSRARYRRPSRLEAPSTPSPEAKGSISPRPATNSEREARVSASSSPRLGSSTAAGRLRGFSLHPRGRTLAISNRNASSSVRPGGKRDGGGSRLDDASASRSRSSFRISNGRWPDLDGLAMTSILRQPDPGINDRDLPDLISPLPPARMRSCRGWSSRC